MGVPHAQVQHAKEESERVEIASMVFSQAHECFWLRIVESVQGIHQLNSAILLAKLKIIPEIEGSAGQTERRVRH